MQSNSFFSLFANNDPTAMIGVGMVAVVLAVFALIGALYGLSGMTTEGRRNTLLFIIIIALAILSSACGGSGGDSNPQPTVGEQLVGDVLNAASNANGDGQVDTTPCNGIVC